MDLYVNKGNWLLKLNYHASLRITKRSVNMTPSTHTHTKDYNTNNCSYHIAKRHYSGSDCKAGISLQSDSEASSNCHIGVLLK